jgi:hypothetical protein
MRPDVLASQVAGTIRAIVDPLVGRVKTIEAAERLDAASLVELADTVVELRERLAVLEALDSALGEGLRANVASYDDVRARLGILEARAPIPGPPGPPGIVYRGPHEVGKTYEVGDCVYTGGSSWVCKTTTSAAPSTASRDWGLVASRGRDGKREPRP